MPHWQLFLDMDGVLADFEAGYEREFGVRPNEKNSEGTDVIAVDWSKVNRRRGFYRDLPPMPDFDELWDYAKRYNPIVLTGVPISMAAKATANKREWVDRHLGPNVPMIGCRSKDKYLHMTGKGDILVDDWERYKHVWIDAGGRWVTHTSAASSIKQVQELMIGW